MANRIERRCAAGHEWTDNVPGRMCPYCPTGSTGSTGSTRATRSTRPTSPVSSPGDALQRWHQLAAEPLPELAASDELCHGCGEPVVWLRQRAALWCRSCNTAQLPAYAHERETVRTSPARRSGDRQADRQTARVLAGARARFAVDLQRVAAEIGHPDGAADERDRYTRADWIGQLGYFREWLAEVGTHAELESLRQEFEQFRLGIYQRSREIQTRAIQSAEVEVYQDNGHQDVIEGEIVEPRESPPRGHLDRVQQHLADLERFGTCELHDWRDSLFRGWSNVARYEIRAPGFAINPIRTCANHLKHAKQYMNGYPLQVANLHHEVSA